MDRKSFVGVCRIRQGYAGVVTFCKDAAIPIAAEEGLARQGGDSKLSDAIGWRESPDWAE